MRNCGLVFSFEAPRMSSEELSVDAFDQILSESQPLAKDTSPEVSFSSQPGCSEVKDAQSCAALMAPRVYEGK